MMDRIMKTKLTRKQKYPYIVKLPKNTPKGYKEFRKYNIVQQIRVLNTFENAELTVRSAEPFIISVEINGKTKQLKSKLEK